MTSIYSLTSTETRLVAHFSKYKTNTLPKKTILNHDFRFFAYSNVTKFCRSIHFALTTLTY